jgi:hypothetical protein
MNQTTLTKAEIVDGVINHYFDDLDFIEKLNNITYAQKVKLKGELKNHHTNTYPKKNERY